MLLRQYVNESEVILHDLPLEDVDDLIEQARRQRDDFAMSPPCDAYEAEPCRGGHESRDQHHL